MIIRTLLAFFGGVIILGVFGFSFIPGAMTFWKSDQVGAIQMIRFIFALLVVAAIYVPIFAFSDRSWMDSVRRKVVWSKLTTAFSLGAIMAWVCCIRNEQALANAEVGVLTTTAFLTFALTGAVCLVQLIPKFRLPQLKPLSESP